MRLLHSTDHTFKEFVGHDIPQYAIVSHRWTDDEVSHHDFEKAAADAQQSPLISLKPGYGWTKIHQGCYIARQRGYEWVWIDTCCIDKKSSAELSEAINSMYEWYQNAGECYVFLPDVHRVSTKSLRPAYKADMPQTVVNWDEFRGSDWFTRAWTLQLYPSISEELLAPRDVIFFDALFDKIGAKEELASVIAEATGIPRKYLDERDERDRTTHYLATVHDTSVAERLRWASKRKATREEDIAYSLLGLFGVNMPLLYGEGSRAFLRLQTEIIRNIDDESVFAWSIGPHDHWNGLLAPNIEAFYRKREIQRTLQVLRQHYEVTNKGVLLELPLNEEELVATVQKSDKAVVLMLLNCTSDGKRLYLLITVRALKITTDTGPGGSPYFVGDRLCLAPIEALKDETLKPEEGRGSPFYDLTSPARSEGETDVSIYFNTGWSTTGQGRWQRRRSLTRDIPM